MKKISILLLILIIAVSSLFARSSFSGKARLRFGAWQQGDGSFNYGFVDKSDVSGTFMVNEFIGSTTGEGKIFGEVSFGGQIRAKVKGQAMVNNWTPLQDVLQYKLFFNYANLVFDKANNFKLSISGNFGQTRYGKGWEIEVDNGTLIGTTPFLAMTTALENSSMLYRAQGGWIPGVTLSYGPFSLGIALDGGSAKTGNTNVSPGVMVLAEMNDLRAIDNDDATLGLSASFGYMQSHNMFIEDVGLTRHLLGFQQHIVAGLGLKYETENLKLALGANANIALNENPYTYEGIKGDTQRYSLEASFNLKHTGSVPLSFDVWYLDNQGLWADEDEPDWVTYENPHDLGYVYRMHDGNLLSGYDGQKGEQGTGANNTLLRQALSAKFTICPVDLLGIEINAQDLLNQAIVGLRLPLHITDAFTLTPGFEYTNSTNKYFDYDSSRWVLESEGDPLNSIYEGYLGFNYNHALFSLFAYARIGHETQAERKDAEDVGGTVYVRPYLSLSSKTLIDNVKLELRWQSATFGNAATAPSGKYHSAYKTNGSQSVGEIYVEARINF